MPGPLRLALLLALGAVAACGTTEDEPAAGEPKEQPPVAAEPKAPARRITGIASYYARSLEGRPTASGEPYDHDALTAAHKTLPFGTRLRVTNPANGRSVVVVVNDRGPFAGNRVLDLSGAAARALGMIEDGTVRVTAEVLN
jgi:rare lipoprotein A